MKKTVTHLGFVCFVILLFLAAMQVRTPLFLKLRAWDSIIIGASSAAMLLYTASTVIKRWRKNLAWEKFTSFFIILLTLITLGIITFKEIQFHDIKNAVLASNNEHFQQVGRHFIIGYHDFNEVKLLVEKGGIGGIFINDHNVEGKSKEEIQKEISALQQIQASHNRPPLIVSADQEGGVVSRLTPPLTELPGLSNVIDDEGTIQQEKLSQFAHSHGTELSELGINVNFAPVVDINEGIKNKGDKHTVIYKRAISDNPDTIIQVSSQYCEILQEYNIICTLKHFPGLGRVENDTHLSAATLHGPFAKIENHEFVPFKGIIANTEPLIMLSHVKLTSIDAYNPVSTSEKVIQYVLRKELGFEGVLVTDDFSMGAVVGEKGGAEKAAIQSFNAGVDLILISYNHDLYYSVMKNVLDAAKDGTINMERLHTSNERLKNLLP